MNDIAVKYSLLDKFAKKEIDDFMDFLLSKQKGNTNEAMSAYKKKILEVSTWSDTDLKTFDEKLKGLFNRK